MEDGGNFIPLSPYSHHRPGFFKLTPKQFSEAMHIFFRVGNIIERSRNGNSFDKVLRFQYSGMGDWQVEVIQSDKDGHHIPGARPRIHFTLPNTGDLVSVLANAKGLKVIDFKNRK